MAVTERPSPTRSLRFLLVNPTIVEKREHLHLGVGTVASYVKQHSTHQVRILDFMASRLTWKRKLKEVCDEFKPDIIGMYISSPYFPAAKSVANEIRIVAPHVPILAGGHHPTLAPDAVMEAPCFDMLIIGEGEKPMVKLLDTIAADRPLEEVPGLWWRENGQIRKTEKGKLLEAEDMPPIDWSLHDEETLRANFYFWGILPVMASRGCPARCSFCSITNIQKMYSGEKFLRFRDPVQVVAEIQADFERYRDYGMRMIFFYDLNFLVNPKWLKAFTDEYKRVGLNKTLKWSAYTRADHVVPSTVECLRDSGCVNLRVGIEAANPYMRNILYEKDVPQPVLLDALRMIKELDISITGYFMAGGPGERPEWLMESLELSKREGVDFPVFFLYKPLAGTDILDRAEELGSRVLPDVEAADFLHGVEMEHEHIKAWQLQLYMLTTHVAFGPSLLLQQLERNGWKYLPHLAEYMARALKAGFTPYGAFTYFTFYGYNHLVDPLLVPATPEPGRLWKGFMKLTQKWMGSSGQPQPTLEPRRPPRAKTTPSSKPDLKLVGLSSRAEPVQRSA